MILGITKDSRMRWCGSNPPRPVLCKPETLSSINKFECQYTASFAFHAHKIWIILPNVCITKLS